MKESDLLRLSAYIDDELDADERRAVEAWLETSAEARTVLAQLQQLDDQLAAPSHAAASAAAAERDEADWQTFASRVQERIGEQTESKSDHAFDRGDSGSPTARPVWRLWAVAASVVLVVWVGARVWQQDPSVLSTPPPSPEAVEAPPTDDAPQTAEEQRGRSEAQRKATAPSRRMGDAKSAPVDGVQGEPAPQLLREAAPQALSSRQDLAVVEMTQLDSLSLQRASVLLDGQLLGASPNVAQDSGAEADVGDAVDADLDTLLWSRRQLPAVRPLAVNWMRQVQAGTQAVAPEAHRRWLTWLRDTAAPTERPTWEALLRGLED